MAARDLLDNGRLVEFLCKYGDYSLSDRAVDLIILILKHMRSLSSFNPQGEIKLNSSDVTFPDIKDSPDKIRSAYRDVLDAVRASGLFRITTSSIKTTAQDGTDRWSGSVNNVAMTPLGLSCFTSDVFSFRRVRVHDSVQHVHFKLFGNEFEVQDRLVLLHLFAPGRLVDISSRLPRYSLSTIKRRAQGLKRSGYLVSHAGVWSVCIDRLEGLFDVQRRVVTEHDVTVSMSPRLGLKFDLMSPLRNKTSLQDTVSALGYLVPGKCSRRSFIRHIAFVLHQRVHDADRYCEDIESTVRFARHLKRAAQDAAEPTGRDRMLIRMDLDAAYSCMFFHIMMMPELIRVLSKKAGDVAAMDRATQCSDLNDQRRQAVQADPSKEASIQQTLRIRLALASQADDQDAQQAIYTQLHDRTRDMTPQELFCAALGSVSASDGLDSIKTSIKTDPGCREQVRTWLSRHPAGIRVLLSDDELSENLNKLFGPCAIEIFEFDARRELLGKLELVIEPDRIAAGMVPRSFSLSYN